MSSSMLQVMQLSLGRRGDYAVRATLALAREPRGTRLKAREIAHEMDIPEKYLPQVLATLVRAGLVGSVAGPDGGYFLLRVPAEVTLREVIEAADGPIRSDTCVLRGSPCRGDGMSCVLHDHWVAAQQALIDRLEKTTFADLRRTDESIVGLAAGPDRAVEEDAGAAG